MYCTLTKKQEKWREITTSQKIKGKCDPERGEPNQLTNTRHSKTTASGHRCRLGMSTVMEQHGRQKGKHDYRSVPALLRLDGHFEGELSLNHSSSPPKERRNEGALCLVPV